MKTVNCVILHSFIRILCRYNGVKVLPRDQFSSLRLPVGTFAASAAASSREAADSGRLTDDWKVVFGYSARIRVKFRASQLYQARGYSSYDLSLVPEASEILFNNNKMVGIGQRLIATKDGLCCAQPASSQG
jgi:hypothetical protein